MNKFPAPKSVIWALLFAGLFFSILHIYSLPLWYDEAITLLELYGYGDFPPTKQGLLTFEESRLLAGEQSSFEGLIQILIGTDVHPPFYYFVLFTFFELFDLGFQELRVFSALCVFCSMVLMVRNEKYHWYTVIAVVIVYFLPMVQWSAINLRGYALALALSTAAIVAFNEYVKSNSFKKLVFCFTLFGLAFFTHYFTIMLAAYYLLVGYIIAIKRRQASVQNTTILALSFSVPFLLSLPFLLNQLGSRPDQYAGFMGLKIELFSVLYHMIDIFHFKTYLFPTFDKIRSLGSGLVFLLLIFFAFKYKTSDKNRNILTKIHLASLFIFLVFLLLLFGITDKTLTSMGSQRYIVFLAPPLFFVVTSALACISEIKIASKDTTQTKSQFLIGSIALGFIGNTFINYYLVEFKPAPWHMEKYFYLIENSMPNDSKRRTCIIAPTNWRGTPVEALFAMNPQDKIIFIKTIHELEIWSQGLSTCKTFKVYKDKSSDIQKVQIERLLSR